MVPGYQDGLVSCMSLNFGIISGSQIINIAVSQKCVAALSLSLSLCIWILILVLLDCLVLHDWSSRRLFTKSPSLVYLNCRYQAPSPVPDKSDNVLSGGQVTSGVVVIDGTVPPSVASAGVPTVPKSSRHPPGYDEVCD